MVFGYFFVASLLDPVALSPSGSGQLTALRRHAHYGALKQNVFISA